MIKEQCSYNFLLQFVSSNEQIAVVAPTLVDPTDLIGCGPGV